MASGSKIPAGRRHPDAWSPEIGWQLLRRSSVYQDAVIRFCNHLKEHGDKASLAEFNRISRERSSDIDLSATGDENYFLRPIKEVFPKILESIGLDYFLILYGDVLRFPINFETRYPEKNLLTSLWKLRPAVLVDDLYTESARNDLRKLRPTSHSSIIENFGKHGIMRTAATKTMHLTFEINTSFSDGAILDDVSRSLEKELAEIRKDYPVIVGSDVKIRWSDFEEALRAWDLKKENPNWTDWKIGKTIYSGEKYRLFTDRMRYDHIRDKLAAVERGINFFDQPRMFRASEALRTERTKKSKKAV